MTTNLTWLDHLSLACGDAEHSPNSIKLLTMKIETLK